MADISANLFAAFMIVFVIIVSRQAQHLPRRNPINLAGIDISRREAPLDASGMIRHLRQRFDGEPCIAIDIHEDSLVVERAPSGPQYRFALPLPLRDRTLLRNLLSGECPAALYVFANGGYSTIVELLQEVGTPWRELDIPDALRRPDGEDWSDGFRDLPARRLGETEFRNALRDLLQGGAGRPLPWPGLARTDVSASVSGDKYPDRSTLFLSLLCICSIIAIETWTCVFRTLPDRKPRAVRSDFTPG